jgi:hypothetical protein
MADSAMVINILPLILLRKLYHNAWVSTTDETYFALRQIVGETLFAVSSVSDKAVDKQANQLVKELYS